jgi:hypothetical protein
MTAHVRDSILLNNTQALITEKYPIAQALLSEAYPLRVTASHHGIDEEAFFQKLQQCAQLITIPLLQGFFEGLIDPCSLHHKRWLY